MAKLRVCLSVCCLIGLIVSFGCAGETYQYYNPYDLLAVFNQFDHTKYMRALVVSISTLSATEDTGDDGTGLSSEDVSATRTLLGI